MGLESMRRHITYEGGIGTMKQSKWMLLTAAFLLGTAGAAWADTISGKVTDVNVPGRSITLISEPGEAASASYTLVWESDFADAASLRRTQVGSFLSVDATQNPVTRHWRVTNVRGPMAAAEDLISSDQRVLEGKVTSIDVPAHRLTLLSMQADASGKAVEYQVVWDESNADVRNRLAKAEVGDKLALKADQNRITRNWKATSVVGPVKEMIQRDVKTITGEIKEIDPAGNYIVLLTIDSSGERVERKIVWDKDFRDQGRLESLKVGDRLSVRASQNAVTRNWKVKAIGS